MATNNIHTIVGRYAGAGDARTSGAPEPPACPSCHAERMPAANYCHRCGSRLQSSGRSPVPQPEFRAERRQVTIVFCDLVDSVRLAAGRDQEDVADAMRQFYGALSATMARFGGYFERPMGDGGLFYFGYPLAAEDDCERAVEAALETVEVIARLPPQFGKQLEVRVGISTGIVVLADMLSASEHGGRDIVGDIPNLAARLQQIARPNCVLVSDAVRQLTRAVFDFEDLGQSHLRGWADPVPIWRPLRRMAHVERFSARLTAGKSPLIGRRAELAELAAAWTRARDGAGVTVLLQGEPGMGKSRLAHELATALLPAGTRIKRYQCAAMQQDAPLYPAIEQFAHEAGLTASETPAARLAKVTAALADCPAADAALIGGLVAPDLPMDDPPAREASPERQRDRILGALLGKLLRSAADRPLAVIVEDAHWSDPSTRVMLARLAAAAPEYPVLLLVTARPQFRPDWATGPDIRRIQLDPLPPAESEELVRAVSGATQLSEDVVADITERTDGVPLFIEEVTRSVLEPGQGDRDVPVSIHASLLSRIDRLGRARGVAEVAATIGRAFDAALLTAVCEVPAAELSHSLGQLVAAGLVQSEFAGGRTLYVFRHALIRDVTYSTMLRRRRRALHARIAGVLEREFPADAAAHPQQLALHYAAGGLELPAASWWLRAGLQSLQRSAMTEAVTQLRRALALLEPLPESPDGQRIMLEVLIVYSKALTVTQGHAAPATREALRRAHVLCHRLGDPPQLLTVLFMAWTLSFFGGRLAAAEAQARDLLGAAERRDDDMWLVMGGYVLGLTRLLRGELREGTALLERADAGFDPARRDAYARPSIGDPHVIMLTFLGWGAMMRGAFSDAARYHEAAIAEARGLRQPFALALALNNHFYTALWLHGPERAAAVLRDYDAAAIGVEHFEAFGEIMRGWLLAAGGDFAGGLAHSQRGRGRHAAAGTWLHHAVCLRMEAEMLLRLGRIEAAMEGLDAARQAQAEIAEQWDDVEFHRLRAEILLALSRDAEADAELAAAQRIALARGQFLFRLRAANMQARLLIRRGAAAAAGALLREALAQVERDPAVLDVAAAEALLGQLTVAA